MNDEAQKADSDSAAGSATPSEANQPLGTVRLNAKHDVARFLASKSERVTQFLRRDASEMERLNYCRVFVLADPEEQTRVLGFYTLSSAFLVRDEVSNSHQRKIPKGIPVPLTLIGYMGRDDTAAKGIGAALIYDAALRVHRNEDVASWGLVLDSEGGVNNPKLMQWYEDTGFTKGRKTPHRMYGPLHAFLSFLPPLQNL